MATLEPTQPVPMIPTRRLMCREYNSVLPEAMSGRFIEQRESSRGEWIWGQRVEVRTVANNPSETPGLDDECLEYEDCQQVEKRDGLLARALPQGR